MFLIWKIWHISKPSRIKELCKNVALSYKSNKDEKNMRIDNLKMNE